MALKKFTSPFDSVNFISFRDPAVDLEKSDEPKYWDSFFDPQYVTILDGEVATEFTLGPLGPQHRGLIVDAIRGELGAEPGGIDYRLARRYAQESVRDVKNLFEWKLKHGVDAKSGLLNSSDFEMVPIEYKTQTIEAGRHQRKVCHDSILDAIDMRVLEDIMLAVLRISMPSEAEKKS